jgi:hypothetical protein
LFLSKGITGENLKQVLFDEKKVFKTIHGDANGYSIKKLFLKDKENKEISKIEAFNDNPG